MPALDSCLTLNRAKLLAEINRRQIKREILAAEIGVTPRTLRRWLHGQTSRVQQVHLDLLAQKLGCSLHDLVAEADRTDPPFQSADVHPLLAQLRHYLFHDPLPENLEIATQLIQSWNDQLPYDVQATVHYEYARFAFQLGHTERARRSLERAVLKADAAGADAIRFQSFLSLAQLSSFAGDEGREKELLFLEQAEHVLLRLKAQHWQPHLWLMEGRRAAATGDLGRALRLGEDAWMLIQQAPTAPSLETLESLDMLAFIFLTVGNRRQALDMLKYAEALASPLISAGHPLRGRLLMRLASVHGFLGETVQACREAQASVRILEPLLALENFDRTNAYIQLGTALSDLGDYESALQAFQKSLHGHPDLEARLRTNLGLLLQRMGRSSEALTQAQSAVDLFAAKWGASHPETAAALGRAASPLMDMGQIEKAEGMYREAARLLALADPFHVRILDQVRNQARCLMKMGRSEEAARILDDARRIYTKRDESPVYRGRFSLLQAQVLARLGSRQHEALRWAQDARNLFQSPGIDPALAHEAEVLIQRLRLRPS